MKRIIYTFIIAITPLLGDCQEPSAYYVSTDGDDGNDGSIGLPGQHGIMRLISLVREIHYMCVVEFIM